MSREVFQPGQVWPGTELTPSVFQAQWQIEFTQIDNLPGLAEIVFTDASWEELDWNAREALHLNNRWPKAPGIWRHLFVPQDPVNMHLMRSLQMLLLAWQHWLQLPFVGSISTLPAVAERYSILGRANGRFEQAQVKIASLQSRRKLLQQFSLRQWRLYQHVSALYNDLEPLVEGSANYGLFHDRENSIQKIAADIRWHAKELHLLVKRPEYRPSQKLRLWANRLRINQLSSATCLYHSTLLQELLSIE